MLRKQRAEVAHTSTRKASGPCPKLPDSGLWFPAEEKYAREQAWSRLWLSASPRARGLSQPGAKQCHESGPGWRLVLGHGGALGLGRRRRSGRSRITNREGQLPSLTYPSSWSSVTEAVRHPSWKRQPRRGPGHAWPVPSLGFDHRAPASRAPPPSPSPTPPTHLILLGPRPPAADFGISCS